MHKQHARLFEEAREHGVTLDPSQVKKLYDWAGLVWEKGTVLGLSGRKSLDEILNKDILDSLLLVPLISCRFRESGNPVTGTPPKVLDIGSGAGFPGIALKIALPELSVTLLEAKQKAARFLQTVQRQLGVEVKIFPKRAEECSAERGFKGRFDVVTGRAVAHIERFLPWAIPFLRPGGRLILQKGKKWETEVEKAKTKLTRLGVTLESASPGLEGDQKIVILRKTQ